MQVNGINFRVENRYYIVPLVLILQILLSSLIRQLSIEGSRQNLTGKHHNHINGANSFTERRISWSSIIINYALNSGAGLLDRIVKSAFIEILQLRGIE